MTTKFFTQITSGVLQLVDAITSFTGNSEEILATGSDGKIDTSLIKEYDSFEFYATRNRNNQPNQFLRREDSIPTNEAPFKVKFDGEIFGAAVGDRDQNINSAWDLEITINGASPTVVLSKLAGSASNTTEGLSINVSAGDLITLAMVNQSETIRDPSGSIHGRRRV